MKKTYMKLKELFGLMKSAMKISEDKMRRRTSWQRKTKTRSSIAQKLVDIKRKMAHSRPQKKKRVQISKNTTMCYNS